MITVQNYLNSKFLNRLPICITGNALQKILLEFEKLLLSNSLKQTHNPKTNSFIITEADTGIIVGNFKYPLFPLPNQQKQNIDATGEISP